MVIGTLYNGGHCVYDLPMEVKTVAEFESLISGYNDGEYMERTREELWHQPKLKGLKGPMWNGWGIRKSTGEKVAIIRYER